MKLRSICYQLWIMFETLVTVLDRFFNLCLHSFPPVSSLDFLVGFRFILKNRWPTMAEEGNNWLGRVTFS